MADKLRLQIGMIRTVVDMCDISGDDMKEEYAALENLEFHAETFANMARKRVDAARTGEAESA